MTKTVKRSLLISGQNAVPKKIKSKVTQVISLFNQAGGVGKTTLTMNLGYSLAKRDHRVLLIDMDPQASLTTFMGLVPKELGKALYETIVNEEPLTIHKGIHDMDLAPSNINLSVAEMLLVGADLRDFRLAEAIAPVLDDYDFILIDCPPSLGLLSYISLVAATQVLVPIETHFKAFQGTDLLLQTFTRIRKKPNRRLAIAGFVPTRYDTRNSQDSRTLKAIHEQLSEWGKIFPPIPRSTVFVDASEQQLPLALYSPKHPSLKIIEEISQCLEKLG